MVNPVIEDDDDGDFKCVYSGVSRIAATRSSTFDGWPETMIRISINIYIVLLVTVIL